MDCRGPLPVGAAPSQSTAFGAKKNFAQGLLDTYESLWQECSPAFAQRRLGERARALGLGALVSFGRGTITGLLSACGRQFCDWSADYRLFSERRFDPAIIFGVVRRGVVAQLGERQPLVVAMDDSLLRKTGPKAHGVAYRRDPLGPPFHVNFVRAQRVLQLSAALPPPDKDAPARLVPVDFQHAPTPKKPKKNAPAAELAAYQQAKKETNINKVGSARLRDLRSALDQDGQQQRRLWVVVDGRFTNRTVLKNLPPRTTLIGRVRKDAKLNLAPPAEQNKRGRKRCYGEQAPTPEELRRDEDVPWQRVRVFAAGKMHRFKVKALTDLRWRPAGPHRAIKLVVIAALAYRPRKGSRLLYRQPAYLICTDPALSTKEIVQSYVWRWDIEVNFRDEKQLIGVGQAQVRTENSVETVPALLVACYALLLLAARQAFGGKRMPLTLPKPKWRNDQCKQRDSTKDLIDHLRTEMWGAALGITNFSGFPTPRTADQNPEKLRPHLPSAVLYAVN